VGLETSPSTLDLWDPTISISTPAPPALTPAAMPTRPPTDKDGNRRPHDGNGDGKAVCDMGAYEYVGPPYIDLAVTGGSIQPSTGRAGQAIDVTLRVANIGLYRSAGNWTHVYLSKDATYDPSDYLWIPGVSVPPLAAGQETSGVLHARIPSVASASYYVIAHCDVINEVAEWDEQNNWKAIGVLTVPTSAARWSWYRCNKGRFLRQFSAARCALTSLPVGAIWNCTFRAKNQSYRGGEGVVADGSNRS